MKYLQKFNESNTTSKVYFVKDDEGRQQAIVQASSVSDAEAVYGAYISKENDLPQEISDLFSTAYGTPVYIFEEVDFITVDMLTGHQKDMYNKLNK